jgi:hypothetical protein
MTDGSVSPPLRSRPGCAPPDRTGRWRKRETLNLYNNQLTRLPECLRGVGTLKRIYLFQSGLSMAALEKSFPGVELNTEIPPEVYLQLN